MVPSGFTVKGMCGSGGIPVGPIMVAAPVLGFTEYKLLLKSVRYSFPFTPARSNAVEIPVGKKGNPKEPMVEVAPVAGLMDSRFPETVPTVKSDPFGPHTRLACGSGSAAPMVWKPPDERLTTPNWLFPLTT